MKGNLFQKERRSKTRPAPLGGSWRKESVCTLRRPSLEGRSAGTEEELQRLREERSTGWWQAEQNGPWREDLCRCPVRPSLERASAGVGSCLLECRLREQPPKERSAVAAQTAVGWSTGQHKWEHSQRPESPQKWSTTVKWHEEEEWGHCCLPFHRGQPLPLQAPGESPTGATLPALATASAAMVAPMGCLHARVGLILQLSLRGSAM